MRTKTFDAIVPGDRVAVEGGGYLTVASKGYQRVTHHRVLRFTDRTTVRVLPDLMIALADEGESP